MTNPLDGNGVAMEPCPFCGGTAKVERRDVEPQGDPWYGSKLETIVTCDGCAATLFDGYFHDGFSGPEAAIAAWNRRAPLASHTAVEPVALAYSGECIDIAREAFDAWASKPHNKRWFKRIDGTPIINDIIVNMAVTFGAHGVIAKRAPSDLMVPLSALTEQTAAREAAEKERDQLIAAVKLMEYSDGDALHWRALCDHAVARAEAAEARALTAHDDAIRKAAEVAREAIKVSVVLVPRGPFMSGELPSPKELEKQVKAAILSLLSDAPKTEAGR